MRWRDLIFGIDYGNNNPADWKAEVSNATQLVEGVTIKFGRPASELEKKLAQNKDSGVSGAAAMGTREDLLQYIQERGPIDVYVNPDGSLELYNDGNTRLYAANQKGISPQDIPARYYIEGSTSRVGTLEDALMEAKKQHQKISEQP